MSASKAAATAAGRALLKAGARSLPVARGGGRRGSSKVARGLASVTLNQQQHRGAQGAMFMGVSACTAAVVGLAALLESEDLEGVLPAGMLEKLQQQGSSTALARIEEFYTVDGGETLGRGQFGTVCKATDKATGEVVAVKCVPRTMASEAHFREEADVHREAANHPNVVGMKGAFADEDCWYMVMQLADGGELYDRLTTEGYALNDREIRSLIRDTADALGFLHDRSIVHGDVKPENLLLTAPDTAPAAAASSSERVLAAAAAAAVSPKLREEAEREGGAGGGEAVAEASDSGGEGAGPAGAVGNVLLADFGSSFRMSEGGSGGMKTVKEYTVAYSAPEVVDHSPEISAKADVWSLGVIAYVMVKGHHPFDPTSDADDEEISENILYSDPDWDGVEPKAATLIRQMLSRDPRDRPSAREVLQNSWLQQLQ